MKMFNQSSQYKNVWSTGNNLIFCYNFICSSKKPSFYASSVQKIVQPFNSKQWKTHAKDASSSCVFAIDYQWHQKNTNIQLIIKRCAFKKVVKFKRSYAVLIAGGWMPTQLCSQLPRPCLIMVDKNSIGKKIIKEHLDHQGFIFSCGLSAVEGSEKKSSFFSYMAECHDNYKALHDLKLTNATIAKNFPKSIISRWLQFRGLPIVKNKNKLVEIHGMLIDFEKKNYKKLISRKEAEIFSVHLIKKLQESNMDQAGFLAFSINGYLLHRTINTTESGRGGAIDCWGNMLKLYYFSTENDSRSEVAHNALSDAIPILEWLAFSPDNAFLTKDKNLVESWTLFNEENYGHHIHCNDQLAFNKAIGWPMKRQNARYEKEVFIFNFKLKLFRFFEYFAIGLNWGLFFSNAKRLFKNFNKIKASSRRQKI